MQLIVEKLNLRRGQRLLVKELSFQLEAGTALNVKGINGVGKTTLLRAIAGFIQPISGKIELISKDPANNHDLKEPVERGSQLHYIGHKNGYRASLTVVENLEFWRRFLNPRADLKTIATRFSLTPLLHIKAGYLSQGQGRRLALSRLAIAPRPLWLLDEPTVSLDQKSTALMAETARQHVQSGGLLIAISHIPLEIDFDQEINLAPVLEHIPEALI